MGTANIQLDAEYGAGAREVQNPAWDAWEAQRAALQARLDGLQGPGMEGQRMAVQDDLNRHMAQQPPRTMPNHLGGATNAIEQQGVDSAAALRQGGANAVAAGADAFNQGQQVAEGLYAVGTNAQNRGAPTLNVTPGGRTEQQAAGQAVAQFRAPQEVAQNINNVTNDQVQALGNFRAGDAGAQGIRNAGVAGSTALNNFRAATSGVQALNQFAKGPSGPSAAEAMLRLQAAKDKAAALSRARSVRGGPGAVAEAMKVAQAEAAGISSDTRGQSAIVRANEAAANRAQSLQALSAAGGLEQQASQTNLGALQGAASTNLQGQQAATTAELQGAGQRLDAASTAAGLAVQGATAAGQAALGASAQNLEAMGVRADIANNVRGMDIEEAKTNLSAELQSISMNDEQTRFFAGLSEQARQAANEARANAIAQGMDAEAAAAQVGLSFANQVWQMLSADQQAELQEAAMRAGVVQQSNANKAQERQAIMGMIGGGLTAGAMAVKSDRRAKRDIRQLKSMAASLRKTPGSSYRYKNGRDGQGRFTGPMAQDLEKTPEFRSAVRKGPDGQKIVDTARLTMSHHAALSDLQRQIDRLEKLGRRKAKDTEPEETEA